jgi:WD40 repeat protein
VFTRGLDTSGSELSVSGVSFSPDGKSLLVSGSNDTTRIYSWEMFAPLGDLLALGRTRATRDLTSDEKKKYLHQAVAEKERPLRQE